MKWRMVGIEVWRVALSSLGIETFSKNAGLTLTREDAKKLFEAMDVNQSGEIDYTGKFTSSPRHPVLTTA